MSTVTVSLSGLQAAQQALRGDFPARVARQAADGMQDKARAYAPKDTTALAQSISVQTHDFSDYEANVEIAQGFNPKALFFPPPTTDVGPGQAVVAVGATYGAFVNGGTSRQAAQPFFDRARFEAEQGLAALAEATWRDAWRAP